jgi:sucrose-6-phosphate hydrolase SacC (GH32 family)
MMSTAATPGGLLFLLAATLFRSSLLLSGAVAAFTPASSGCGGTGPRYHVPVAAPAGDVNALFGADGHTHLMHSGWAHWVSADAGVHWRRLPPPTGLTGGMDGSLSFVGGRAVVLYDCTSVAHCKPANVSGGVGAASGDPPIIGVARPSNSSDALLTNWSRAGSNPITVHDTAGRPVTTGFAGPSNLWQPTTAAGGGTTEMTMITGAQSTGLFRTNDSSLHSWTLVNPAFYSARGGGGGLFFPLPGKGGGGSRNGSTTAPTHLLQVDVPGQPDGASTFALGRVVADTFVVDNSSSSSSISQLDGGGFLFAQIGAIADAAAAAGASSSSADRLMIAGWMSIARVISVVRELSYDSVSRQLLSYPIAELASLRTAAPLAAHANVTVAPGATLELISGGASSADVEIELSGLLENSSSNATVGIGVLGGTKRDHAGRIGLVFEVQLTSSGSGGAAAERRVSVSGVCSKPAKGKTTPVHCVACPATSFLLPLGQDTLSLRVLVDRTAVEFFAGDGRIACSGSVARVPEEASTGVSIVNTMDAGSPARAVAVSKATVWGMSCAFDDAKVEGSL